MKCRKTMDRLTAHLPVKITALGDSLTYGWMVSEGFAVRLKAMLEKEYPGTSVKMKNLGVPGDTSHGGLNRLGEQVLTDTPDLVMVQFGLNDALAGYSPEELYENLRQICMAVRGGTGAELLLVTSPLIYHKPLMNMVFPYYEAVKKAAEDQQVPLAEVHVWWEEKIRQGEDHRKLVQADFAHPTERGHELMAEAILQSFIE